MKKLSFILVIFLFACVLVGCGDKTVDYAEIYRDDFKTGGDITFEYDKLNHIAYFGGENEVIQYYKEDIAKGWNKEGYRIGIKLYPPMKLTNYQSANAKLGKEEYSNGSFYKKINEQNFVAEFYPIIDENTKEVELKIVWQDGISEQNYKIVIKEGTKYI